ncbi:CD63 antigen [Leptinotarsa decemlineata]|uniref:CD63 antigen n=1 Tax=Leptinotarsa decemlineata TaxID=7539 RepID=UPI003D304DC2
MCCRGKCIKQFSYFCVGLFLFLAISEILLGAFSLVIMQLTETSDIRLGYSYVSVPPLSLVSSGILLFSLIILGCCGITKEITCCVHLYSIILLVLALLQIVVGIVSVYPILISNEEKASLRFEITKHLEKHRTANSTTLDNIHSLMQCCGRTFPNDTVFDLYDYLPQSCCEIDNSQCSLNSTSLHQFGCTPKLMDFIIFQNNIVGLLSVSSGAIEITAGIAGLCLGYRLLKDGTTSYEM